MLGPRHLTAAVLAGAIALAFSYPLQGAQAQTPTMGNKAEKTARAARQKVFRLTSTTFKDGHLMPQKVANSGKDKNPNCVGENVSPELSWVNPPEGTKSFAILMFDPEGRPPQGVSHWVAYGIPASVKGFAEGEVSKDSDKYVGGKSTQGVGHYSGPCTPPGAPHHYTFILLATDLDPHALKPGLNREEAIKALTGHVKGVAGLIGLFRHPR